MTANSSGDVPEARDVLRLGEDAPPSTLLDDLNVVGIGWRRGSHAVARYVLPNESRGPALLSLFEALRAREMSYLSTCNRVEVTLLRCGSPDEASLRSEVHVGLRQMLTDHGHEPDDLPLEHDLRVWRGVDALRHLARVAAGLDSALLGEREIRGQLRDAVRESVALGIAGAALERITSGALQIANRVHEATGVGRGRTSLAEIALGEVKEHLERSSGPVALVGVSEMTRRCAERLHSTHELILVNRTLQTAHEMMRELRPPEPESTPTELASRPSVEARSLDDFLRDPGRVTAVISAAATDHPLFGREQLARIKHAARDHSAAPVLVDFGVPPNIDEADAEILGFRRLGMDEISERAALVREKRDEELSLAEELVEAGVEDVRRRLAQRSLSGVLRTLSQRYRDTADDGLNEIFARELSHLDEGTRVALREWAHRLARRLAHVPILGLRGLAAEQGNDAVTTFLRAADPSLLRSLHTTGEPEQGSGEAPPDETARGPSVTDE